MEVVRFELDYRRSDIFTYHNLCDIHAGTGHCDEDRFRHKVRQIARDPFARWTGGGDYGEFINPKDKRFDSRTLAKWVDPDDIARSQEEYIIRLLRPIKTQCLGMIEGNHEDSVRIHCNQDVYKHITDELGVAKLGATAFIDLAFRRRGGERGGGGTTIRIVLAHGSGGAITKSAKTIRLERFMNQFNARIYAIGHMHDIIPNEIPYLDLKAGRIIERKKVGAICGSWFTNYTQGLPPSYGEKKTFPPTSLGSPVFIIEPDKDFVTVQK